LTRFVLRRSQFNIGNHGLTLLVYMLKRDELTKYLNALLECDKFRDSAIQGLQVEGKDTVSSVATGVSVSEELFLKAIDAGTEMIIVHHGILWERDSRVVKGILRKRLCMLLENNISLVAYHLPLDAHPLYGNNAVAAKRLGLTGLKRLGDIGFYGQVKLTTLDSVAARVKGIFLSEPVVFGFGPRKIRRIGFCSGGAARDITHAIEEQCDVFITGEADEPTLHIAKEAGIHFIAAGHYATEKFGIQALGDHIAAIFRLPVQFFDIPNPI
jgi:dinuclear metal center YbgI/SA1388 family protein